METVTILKTAALKAYENGSAKQKTLLEDLLGKKTFLTNVMERIKNFNDAALDQDLNPEDYSVENLTGDERSDMFHTRLRIIAKSLNEGWVANFNDPNQRKYRPYFYADETEASGVGLSYDAWTTRARVRVSGPAFM